MYAGDARSKWPQALLTDRRVSHYWDEPRTLGASYLMRLPAMLDRRAQATMQPTADAMWDAFYVYGPDDSWVDPVPIPVRWGYPIMVTREEVAGAIEQFLPK
jgi:hypothetical protein